MNEQGGRYVCEPWNVRGTVMKVGKPEKKIQKKPQKPHNRKQKPEGGQRKRGDVWSSNELCDVASADLMFSIVSSGIGATVCTAGRFLLVAPLTNDDEEEEEEEAESVAPKTAGRVINLKTKKTNKKTITTVIRIKHNDWGQSRGRNNDRRKALTCKRQRPKPSLDRISPDVLLLVF